LLQGIARFLIFLITCIIIFFIFSLCYFLLGGGGGGSAGQFVFYAESMVLIERKNYYSKPVY